MSAVSPHPTLAARLSWSELCMLLGGDSGKLPSTDGDIVEEKTRPRKKGWLRRLWEAVRRPDNSEDKQFGQEW